MNLTVQPTPIQAQSSSVVAGRLELVELEHRALVELLKPFYQKKKLRTLDEGVDLCVQTRTLWAILHGLIFLQPEAADAQLLKKLKKAFKDAFKAVKTVNLGIPSLKLDEEARKSFHKLLLESTAAREKSIQILINKGSLSEFEKAGIFKPSEQQLRISAQWFKDL